MNEAPKKRASAIDAQKDIKYVVSLLKRLADFSDELEQVGSIEKLAKTRQIEHDSLERQYTELQAKHTELTTNVEVKMKAAEAEAAKRVSEFVQQAKDDQQRNRELRMEAAELRRQANEELTTAQAQAKSAVESARKEVEKLIEDGKQSANKIVADARALAETTEGEVRAAQAQRDAAVAEVKRLKQVFAA